MEDFGGVPRTRLRIPQIESGRGNSISTRGAAIDALEKLQRTLLIGVDIANRRQEDEIVVASRQAEELLQAQELAGEIETEDEFAAKYQDTYGKNIYAATRGFKERYAAQRGRVAGKQFSLNLLNRVANGEFADLEDFDKFVDTSAEEASQAHGLDAAESVGWLSRVGPVADEARIQLGSQVLDNRMADAQSAFMDDVSIEFERLATNASPTAQEDFGTAVEEIALNLGRLTPGDAVRKEETLYNALLTLSSNESNLDLMDEAFAEVEKRGLVKDPAVRVKMAQLSQRVRDDVYTLSNREDPMQKREAIELTDRATVQFADKGVVDDDTMKSIMRNPMAISRWQSIRSDIERLDDLGNTAQADLGNVVSTLYDASFRDDISGMRAALPTPIIHTLSQTPEGKQVLALGRSMIEQAESGARAGLQNAADYMRDTLDPGLTEEEKAGAMARFYVTADQKGKDRVLDDEEKFAIAGTITKQANDKEAARQAAAAKQAAGFVLPQTLPETAAAIDLIETKLTAAEANAQLARVRFMGVMNTRGPAGEDPDTAQFSAASQLHRDMKRELAEQRKRLLALKRHHKRQAFEQNLTQGMSLDERTNALFYTGSTTTTVDRLRDASN